LDNKQQQIHNDLFFSNEFNLNQSRRTSPGCESPTHLCDSLLSRMQIYKGIGSYFWTSREIQRNKYGSLLMDFPMSYRFLITDRSGSSPSRESFFGGYYYGLFSNSNCRPTTSDIFCPNNNIIRAKQTQHLLKFPHNSSFLSTTYHHHCKLLILLLTIEEQII